MSEEANGRIKLTWAQVVWGVGVLAAILGSWYDLRGQNALTRQEMGLKFQQVEREQALLWGAIHDVQAAPAPQKGRTR